MAWKQAAFVALGTHEKEILCKILCSKTLGSFLRERVQIVLGAADGLTNRQIVKHYGLEEHRVSQWRTRWHEYRKQQDPK